MIALMNTPEFGFLLATVAIVFGHYSSLTLSNIWYGNETFLGPAPRYYFGSGKDVTVETWDLRQRQRLLGRAFSWWFWFWFATRVLVVIGWNNFVLIYTMNNPDQQLKYTLIINALTFASVISLHVFPLFMEIYKYKGWSMLTVVVWIVFLALAVGNWVMIGIVKSWIFFFFWMLVPVGYVITGIILYVAKRDVGTSIVTARKNQSQKMPEI